MHPHLDEPSKELEAIVSDLAARQVELCDRMVSSQPIAQHLQKV